MVNQLTSNPDTIQFHNPNYNPNLNPSPKQCADEILMGMLKVNNLLKY